MNLSSINPLERLADHLEKIGGVITLPAVLTLHWALFFIWHGMDKWFNGEHFFGVRFGGLLENQALPAIGISGSLGEPMAIVVGLIEFSLGILFLLALPMVLHKHAKALNLTSLFTVLSILTFAVFTMGSVIFGERGHVQTQAIVIGALILTWIGFHIHNNADSGADS